MSKDLAEHHLENAGARETHRVDPNYVDRFRDPDRLEFLRPAQLVKNLHIEQGDHVVEVGCGDGLFLEFLSREVGPHGLVTGIDVEPAMVDTARENIETYDLDNVRVSVSDNDYIPLADQSVDRALLVNVLHEMAYPSESLQELARVMKRGGTVLLFDRHKEETGPDGPPIDHLIDEKQAREWFRENGFEFDQNLEWDPKMYTILFKRTSSGE